MTGTRAGALIEAARRKADLTQTALAARSATSQPAISAYEQGRKVPDLATLERLLAAAGFELRMSLAPLDDHDESLARYGAHLDAAKTTRAGAAKAPDAGRIDAVRNGRVLEEVLDLAEQLPTSAVRKPLRFPPLHRLSTSEGSPATGPSR